MHDPLTKDKDATPSPAVPLEPFSGPPERLLGAGQLVILFVDPADAQSVSHAERFAAMPWPAASRRLLVRADEAPEAVDWFGIRDFPAVAILRNGAVMAIESNCEPEVCRRLLGLAAGRHAACFDA